VAQGALTTLQGLAKTRVADFVHGADGFGNLPTAMTPTVSCSEQLVHRGGHAYGTLRRSDDSIATMCLVNRHTSDLPSGQV